MHDFRDTSLETTNPYESPRAVSSLVAEPNAPRLNENMKAWEWLRVWYNAILAGEVLLLFLPLGSHLLNGRFAVFVLEGAILANVCFCVGPVLEFYLDCIGFRGKWVRQSLFVLGTLFAMLLALGTIFSIFVSI